jgi:hypothetical protein
VLCVEWAVERAIEQAVDGGGGAFKYIEGRLGI